MGAGGGGAGKANRLSEPWVGAQSQPLTQTIRPGTLELWSLPGHGPPRITVSRSPSLPSPALAFPTCGSWSPLCGQAQWANGARHKGHR